MKRSRIKLRILNLLVLAIGSAAFILMSNPAQAQQKISAAVVGGFIQTFHEIAAAYEEKTGAKMEVTFSSAGRLYSQITNGAPYDIYLSADRERPDLLHSKGISEKPFIYAIGEVVLWSSNQDFCIHGDWRAALAQNGVRKIAIVNPATGVHGEKAKKALQDAGLWDGLVSKLVYAQDMAQAFQYASEGAVDAAFCPLALAYTDKGKKGCYYEMREAQAIVYSACVIKNAKNHEQAKQFAAFLVSPDAEKIKRKYGYQPVSGKEKFVSPGARR
ncbi:MAG: molybdate ABC transporter substrate-binding protein [Smithella sp.]|jgi:molybdate transport system substrate-binding protein